jgi:nardilysin
MNDPVDRPGLAHFLEHMIFMGSSKYPKEDAFEEHINSNNGESNACTELEATLYHFEIDLAELKKALSMMAWLLTKPVLNKEAMDREIKAVNSEFSDCYTDDNDRMWELLGKHSFNEDGSIHPTNRFTWGNIKSLTGFDSKDYAKSDSEKLW